MANYSQDERDNESYESWDEIDDETDDETEIDDIVFEPEEISLTKYNIILCEKYNILTHGLANEIKYHYLTHIRLRKLDLNYINDITLIYPRLRLEIGECLYLPSHHCISILKTFWLKIIQRTWKNIYKDRKQVILRRLNPNALKYREINGRWPDNCINYPNLRGMLSNLSISSFRTTFRTTF